MNARFVSLWLLLLLLSVGLHSIPTVSLAADTGLVRIVVLDTSGSMSGERIDIARKEILQLCQQLPPSQQFPVIVVPFRQSVGDVRTFTDLPSLEAHLNTLEGQGSTNIAAGLVRATQELQPYRNAHQLCVMLYTDGEDSNTQPIHEAEQQLDALFADREQRGLKQTVVFCKRWGGANAAILDAITQQGHAQVVDAGELSLKPVQLEPLVTLAGRRWFADDANVLEIGLLASVQVKGPAGLPPLPPARFACQGAIVPGTGVTDVPSGAPQPTRLLVRYRVQPHERSTGSIRLVIDVSQPPTIRSSKDLVLPVMPLSRIELPIDLPPTYLTHTIRATLELRRPAMWQDALNNRVLVPCDLIIDVATLPIGVWNRPLQLAVIADPGIRVAEATQRLSIPNSGTHRFPVTLETVLTSGKPDARPQIDVGLTLAAVAPATDTTVTPERIHVTQRTAAPNGIQTSIAVRALGPAHAQWIDLQNAVARFETQLEITVDGPVPEHSQIPIQAPPSCRRVLFSPSKVTSGKQVVRTLIEAQLTASRPQSLLFAVLPLPPKGAIRIIPGAPFRVDVMGPPPMQLALQREGRIESAWQQRISFYPTCPQPRRPGRESAAQGAGGIKTWLDETTEPTVTTGFLPQFAAPCVFYRRASAARSKGGTRFFRFGRVW